MINADNILRTNPSIVTLYQYECLVKVSTETSAYQCIPVTPLQRVVLSRWPSHSSAAHDVQVQMRHFLAAVVAAIDDDAVAGIQTFSRSDLGRHDQAATDDRFVIAGQIDQGNDFFLGDH